jgi:hypothetical protein
MAINQSFRRGAVRTLSREVGVYVLCDLDGVPIYVGQSADKKYGIRGRVSRHLTSARSDVIANRQIDVWEIAWVRAYPIAAAHIDELESALYHELNQASALMNGTIPKKRQTPFPIPTEPQVVQVMHPDEIAEKLEDSARLPRQAAHYSALVGHFLAVKNSKEISRAMQAHFIRLTKYHNNMLGIAIDEPDDA